MEFDVFISYHTKSSKAITEAIVNALENKGIRCWYAPRNVSGSYAKSIVEAINKCKIFLLILNKEASYSEDVLNEINLAVERLRKKENITFLPFHITDDDISLDAKYYIGRIHWIDAITPPLEKRIDELTERILVSLDKKEEIQNKEKLYLQGTNYFSVTNFIGREKELSLIEENLQKNGRAVLDGMGGIGKSELAKYYASLHKNKFTTILFGVYETTIQDLIINDKYFPITNFKRKYDEKGNLESNEAFYKRKLEVLRTLVNDKTLLIIDNFDTDDSNIKDILSLNWQILITSRNDLKKYNLPIIKIETLKEKDLLELFKIHYGLPIDNIKETVIEMIKIVGYHTLATVLIASTLKETRIKPLQMLENLRKTGISSEREVDLNYQMQEYHSLYECFSVLFHLSSLKEEEKNILMNLTFFGVEGVLFEQFLDFCILDDGIIVNRLIKKNFILYDHILDKISLHPIIANLVEKELHPNLDNCSSLIKTIINHDSWYMDVKDKKEYARVVLNIYQKFPDIKKEHVNIYLKFIPYFRDTNKLDIAFEICRKIYNILNGKISQELAILYREISYLVHLKDDNKEASLEYVLKMIEISRKGDFKLLLGDGLRRLASNSIIQKKFDIAKESLEEAYQIYLKILPKDSLEFGSCYYHYASLYYEMGDYQKSLEYAKKGYDNLSRHETIENADVASSLKSIGKAYIGLKDYQEALKYLEKSYEMRKRNSVQEEMRTTNEQLADLYVILNRKKEALALYEENRYILENYYTKRPNELKRIEEKIAKCKD